MGLVGSEASKHTEGIGKRGSCKQSEINKQHLIPRSHPILTIGKSNQDRRNRGGIGPAAGSSNSGRQRLEKPKRRSLGFHTSETELSRARSQRLEIKWSSASAG